MTKKEIEKLRNRVYAISHSKFPLDMFFNDIELNKDTNYSKEMAYEDLKLITDEIYRLRELEKKPTFEEVKKEWEEEGFEVICSKERFEAYKQWIERHQRVSHHTSAKIVIEKDFFYIVGQFSNKYTHLLTKTLKALGWK